MGAILELWTDSGDSGDTILEFKLLIYKAFLSFWSYYPFTHAREHMIEQERGLGKIG